jgi:hypothetical protein
MIFLTQNNLIYKINYIYKKRTYISSFFNILDSITLIFISFLSSTENHKLHSENFTVLIILINLKYK